MKKFFIFSVISFAFLSGFILAKDDFTLKSPMISFIDGKSFGIDGPVFGLILQNRRGIRTRVYGAVSKAQGRIGVYDFNGKKYSAIELAQIETENRAEYLSKLHYIQKNKLKYTEDEWQEEKTKIEYEFKKVEDALKKVLEKAKEDFITITSGYVEGINSIKDQLLKLIEEFCYQKGVESCFLLKWGEMPAGKEEDMIRQEINSFKDFAEFCADLSDFLEVLAKSCPKGKKQFIDMVKKAKRAK